MDITQIRCGIIYTDTGSYSTCFNSAVVLAVYITENFLQGDGQFACFFHEFRMFTEKYVSNLVKKAFQGRVSKHPVDEYKNVG